VTDTPACRRVVVGLDTAGRSAVVADGRDPARNDQPTGIVLEEIWRQEHIPARPGDDGVRRGEIGIAPPEAGAVVRILTVLPPRADGAWAPDLHCDDALHVITMLAGTLVVVLEAGEVELGVGESVVLPASMHDLRNTGGEPARFVYTSFPLVR
jgi:mannose-6-phosphate isomerase-like protein (cupin superfamily)